MYVIEFKNMETYIHVRTGLKNINFLRAFLNVLAVSFFRISRGILLHSRAPRIGFCTLCCCFPTKMLHLNASFFPLKCSVSPKKSLKCSDNAHYTNGFFKINFKVYTYKNVQVLQVTTTMCTSS